MGKYDPFITAGAELAGQGINAVVTSNLNKKSREFSREMYDRQRADAKADWNLQNEYNSPAAQMARLKAAGLNPNLVYGNGADAQSSGTVRSSGVPGAQFDAPKFSPGDAMAGYYNTKIQQATYDNLRMQNTVQEQEALLKAAQVLQTNAATSKTYADTKNSEFDYWLKDQIKNISMQSAQAGLDKIIADTKFTLDSNQRAIAAQSSSLMEAAERILKSQSDRATNAAQRQEINARIGSIKKDTELKQLDINLKEKGVQPGDPLWARLLAQFLSKFISLPEQHEKGKKGGTDALGKWFPTTP